MRRWVRAHGRRITFAVFAGGVVVIAMWLAVLTGRVNRQEAARIATIESDYNACIMVIPFLKQMNELSVRRGWGVVFPQRTKLECERRRQLDLAG